jgi:hypothetical protein
LDRKDQIQEAGVHGEDIISGSTGGSSRGSPPPSSSSRPDILLGSIARLIKRISSYLLGLQIGYNLMKHWRIIKRNSSSLLILQAGYPPGKHLSPWPPDRTLSWEALEDQQEELQVSW